MNKTLTTFLALIIATLLLVATNFYLVETDDHPQNSNLCDFKNSVCSKVIENVQLLLSVDPKVIKTESEIVFKLLIKSEKSVQITSAWLEGKDMFMGKIPLFFTENEITATGSLASAQTMIGACTEESMIWVMNVAVEIEGESRLIQFYFESQR